MNPHLCCPSRRHHHHHHHHQQHHHQTWTHLMVCWIPCQPQISLQDLVKVQGYQGDARNDHHNKQNHKCKDGDLSNRNFVPKPMTFAPQSAAQVPTTKATPSHQNYVCLRKFGNKKLSAVKSAKILWTTKYIYIIVFTLSSQESAGNTRWIHGFTFC